MSSSTYSPPPLQHPIPRVPFTQPEVPPSTTNSPTYNTPQFSQQQNYQQQSSPYAQQQQSPYSSMGGSGDQGFQSMGQMGAAAAGGQHRGGNQQQQSFNPSWGMNDATTAMGMQFGKHAFDATSHYVDQNFTRHLPLPLLKHSFDVTNQYVLKKLGVVLCPWTHGKKWARSAKRAQEGGGNSDGWLSPRDDINAPDLYIPSMSLLTYILLSALHSGIQSRFHPEVLGLAASKALGVVLLEFLAIKLGTYLLDVRGGAVGIGGSLEMIMYGGYKFVGIIVTLLVGLLNPSAWIYYSVFFYVVLANGFFLLRSLKFVVLPDASTTPVNVSASISHTISHAQRTTRVYFLFFIAIAQLFLMSLLVWV